MSQVRTSIWFREAQLAKRDIEGNNLPDIINGKVWIQYDGTEDGVGYALEAAGIPKEDIVPAFHPESVRVHTGYAVA